MNVGVIRWEGSEEERVGKVDVDYSGPGETLSPHVELVKDPEQGGVGDIHLVIPLQGRGYTCVPWMPLGSL